MKYCCFLSLWLLSLNGNAQSLTDTGFNALRLKTIRTNQTGMRVLGAWGLSSAAGGLAGALSAEDKVWRHWHQMNAIWGVVNLGIAGLGLRGAQRELRKPVSEEDAQQRYKAVKRLYLINAGLDGLYMATGVLLHQQAKYHRADRDAYIGFGNSLFLQGAGLLIFDVSMFLAHQSSNRRWKRALSGFSMTGNGIRWRYAIQ